MPRKELLGCMDGVSQRTCKSSTTEPPTHQALEEGNAPNSRWQACSTFQKQNQGDASPMTSGHVQGHLCLVQLGGSCWHPGGGGGGPARHPAQDGPATKSYPPQTSVATRLRNPSVSGVASKRVFLKYPDLRYCCSDGHFKPQKAMILVSFPPYLFTIPGLRIRVFSGRYER